MKAATTLFAINCALLPLLQHGQSMAQTGQDLNGCGAIHQERGGYGPYDYRTQRQKLAIVEPYHFTPQVESLIRGQSGYLGGDLSYLMRTSPNHHRGLMAIMRFVERTKNPQPPHMQYSIDCYFDRAIRFAPDDTIVRVLFASYLKGKGERDAAEQQLKIAIGFAGDNPLSHFNIGLTLFQIGSYELALQEAHKARSLGLERPELEQQLKEAGHWRDPAN